MAVILKRTIINQIPKTGTIGARAILEEAGIPFTLAVPREKRALLAEEFYRPDHWKSAHHLPHPKGLEEEKVKAVFFRDPLHWYPSIFSYRWDPPNDDPESTWSDKRPFDKKTKDKNFIDFLIKVKEAYPDGLLYPIYNEFWERSDIILRTESLFEDLQWFIYNFEGYLVTKDVKKNVSKHKPPLLEKAKNLILDIESAYYKDDLFSSGARLLKVKKKKVVTIAGVPNRDIKMRKDPKEVKGLWELCSEIKGKRHKSLLEIGSFKGESTEIFAKNFKKVYAIDPWEPDFDPIAASGLSTLSKEDFAYVEQTFDEVVKRNKNITKLKGYSSAYKEKFPPDSIDIVYIDGLHSYEGMKEDITNYLPVAKEAIAGHDYNSATFPGVTRAITELIGEPDMIFADNSWIKFNKKKKRKR